MIPDGADCAEAWWCDSTDVCARVCRPGTLRVDPWLRETQALQASLARGDGLCSASVLGTHNSAITGASGFGARDAYFEGLLGIGGGGARIRTNNHYFGVADQLELGARKLEVDAHWFGGGMRVAHCGNLALAPLDWAARALHWALGLAGGAFEWDSATLGCLPGLSGQPWNDAGRLGDTLAEVAEWAARPGNEGEFVILYLDTSPNLARWGRADQLMGAVREALGEGALVTRGDVAPAGGGGGAGGAAWPTMAALRARGRRFLVVTRPSAGLRGRDAFGADEVCGTSEPSVEAGAGEVMLWPDCSFRAAGSAWDAAAGGYPLVPTRAGTVARVAACDLSYGPMNCEGGFRPSRRALDAGNVPELVRCGFNQLDLDSLDEERSALAVWSWAGGHPRHPGSRFHDPRARPAWALAPREGGGGGAPACAAIAAADGRWYAADCGAGLPSACLPAGSSDYGDAAWRVEPGGCGAGWRPATPAHPKSNWRLRDLVARAGHGGAFLAVAGPGFEVPAP